MEIIENFNTFNPPNVLLIDTSIVEYEEFYANCNSNTLPIYFNSNTDKVELINTIKDKFNKINRLAIAFKFTLDYFFLNNQPLFNIDTESNISGENVDFIIDLINEFKIQNVDYLACNTLNYTDYKLYFEFLKLKTGVVIGASNNQTGNLKYGGDWIMENTSEDIKFIYFNSGIEYYKHLLDDALVLFVIMNDGSIYSCGYVGSGTIGNTTNTFAPNVPLVQNILKKIPYSGSTPKFICQQTSNVYVLTVTNQIFCLGNNANLIMPVSTRGEIKTLTQMNIPIPNSEFAISIACSSYLFFVLTNKGNIYGRGVGLNSQIDFNRFFEWTKIDVPGIYPPKYITAIRENLFVITTDNELYMCGRNDFISFNVTSNLVGNYIVSLTKINLRTRIFSSPLEKLDSLYAIQYSDRLFITTLTPQGVQKLYRVSPTSAGRNFAIDVSNIVYKNNTRYTIKQISGGVGHTLLLLSDGTVYSTGDNGNMQLGLNNNIQQGNFTLIPESVQTKVKEIYGLSNVSFVISDDIDNKIYGFGSNSNGLIAQVHANTLRLNYGTFTLMNLQIPNLTQVSEAKSGKYFPNYQLKAIVKDNTTYQDFYIELLTNQVKFEFEDIAKQADISLINSVELIRISTELSKTILSTSIETSISSLLSKNDSIILSISTDKSLLLSTDKSLGNYSINSTSTSISISDTIYKSVFDNVYGITLTSINNNINLSSMLSSSIRESISSSNYNSVSISNSIYFSDLNKLSKDRSLTSYIILLSNDLNTKSSQADTLHLSTSQSLERSIIKLSTSIDTSIYTSISNETSASISSSISNLNQLTNDIIKTYGTTSDEFTLNICTVDGKLYVCGSSVNGTLGFDYAKGINYINKINVLTNVANLTSKIIAITNSSKNSFVLTESNEIFGCGDNTRRIINSSSLQKIESYTKIVTPLPNGETPRIIVCNDYCLYVLTNLNNIYGRGNGTYGSLGSGSPTNANGTYNYNYNFGPLNYDWTKITIPDTTKIIKKIFCNKGGLMVLSTDNSLYCCGTNYKNLAYFPDPDSTYFPSYIPTLMKIPTFLIDNKESVIQVYSSTYRSVFITNYAHVYVCGSYDPSFASLGTEFKDTTLLNPIEGNKSYNFIRLPYKLNLYNILPENVFIKKISFGKNHTLMLTSDNTVYSCGDNRYGQLGVGDFVNRNIFTKIINNTGTTVKSVYATINNSYFIMNNGMIYGSGADIYGFDSSNNYPGLDVYYNKCLLEPMFYNNNNNTIPDYLSNARFFPDDDESLNVNYSDYNSYDMIQIVSQSISSFISFETRNTNIPYDVIPHFSREVSKITSIDKSLSTAISKEIIYLAQNRTVFTTLYTTLSNSILTQLNTESYAQNSVDNVLSNRIKVETSQRISSDKSLESSLNKYLSSDISSRISSDNKLIKIISIESSSRLSNELKLSSNITSLVNSLSSEISSNNSYNISLSDKITTIPFSFNNLNTEISLRNSADISLYKAINKEINDKNISLNSILRGIGLSIETLEITESAFIHSDLSSNIYNNFTTVLNNQITSYELSFTPLANQATTLLSNEISKFKRDQLTSLIPTNFGLKSKDISALYNYLNTTSTTISRDISNEINLRVSSDYSITNNLNSLLNPFATEISIENSNGMRLKSMIDNEITMRISLDNSQFNNINKNLNSIDSLISSEISLRNSSYNAVKQSIADMLINPISYETSIRSSLDLSTSNQINRELTSISTSYELIFTSISREISSTLQNTTDLNSSLVTEINKINTIPDFLTGNNYDIINKIQFNPLQFIALKYNLDDQINKIDSSVDIIINNSLNPKEDLDSSYNDLLNDVSNNIQIRISIDDSVINVLSKEISNQLQSTKSLDNLISSEMSMTTSSDISLSLLIDTLNTRIIGEANNRTTVNNALSTRMSRSDALDVRFGAALGGSALTRFYLSPQILVRTNNNYSSEYAILAMENSISSEISTRTENYALFETNVNQITTNLTNETQTMTDLFNEFSYLISRETNLNLLSNESLNNSKNDISNSLETDISKRISFTTSLETSIHSNLTSYVSIEQSSRISIDSSLNNLMINEISIRTSNDNSAQQLISTEISQYISSYNQIYTNLSSETSNRMSIETSIGNYFSNQLSLESSSRVSSYDFISINLSSSISLITSTELSYNLKLNSSLNTQQPKRTTDYIILNNKLSVENSSLRSDIISLTTILNNGKLYRINLENSLKNDLSVNFPTQIAYSTILSLTALSLNLTTEISDRLFSYTAGLKPQILTEISNRQRTEYGLYLKCINTGDKNVTGVTILPTVYPVILPLPTGPFSFTSPSNSLSVELSNYSDFFYNRILNEYSSETSIVTMLSSNINLNSLSITNFVQELSTVKRVNNLI